MSRGKGPEPSFLRQLKLTLCQAPLVVNVFGKGQFFSENLGPLSALLTGA